jgi:hypothetical protein
MNTRRLMASLVSRGLADIELEGSDLEIDLEPDTPVMSFDKRVISVDGRMTVPDCNISKACVNPYFGREIPGAEQLGLGADSIYHLYRDAESLAAAADSFENLPLMIQHVATSATEPQKHFIAGVVSNVRWKAPYLVADICVWDAEAIRVIESGAQQELSCGYRYVVEMTPGRTADGESFDGSMLSILGNHVALVSEGRVGPDAHVRE